MKRAFLNALRRRRALIKQRWRNLLEQTPVRTALGNPELLAYLIDDTLNELLASETYLSEDVSNHEHFAEPAHKPAGNCRCGANPYIGFFLTGEAALVSVIRELLETKELNEHGILTAETEMLFALRVRAHRDVDGFCEICQIGQSNAASPEKTAGASIAL